VSITELDFWTLAWVGLAMGLLWLLSLISTDASIVDIFWGIGFVLIAIASGRPEGVGARQALVLALVTVWGLRLAAHLFFRNRGKGEDPRYRAMRRHWGKAFPVVSLLTVFALQAAVMWVVSLPVQAAVRADSPGALGPLDIAGVVFWVVGFVFETVGDLQLARFKRNPGNQGKVMDRGLWSYTRHPNYFGDALVWWGFGLIALQTGSWWALAGPLLMTVMLLRVSGVALLERRMERTRPGYDAYKERTSAFVPMPPKTSRPERSPKTPQAEG
jgi:steroid 5-alpha reductase family enzyme